MSPTASSTTSTMSPTTSTTSTMSPTTSATTSATTPATTSATTPATTPTTTIPPPERDCEPKNVDPSTCNATCWAPVVPLVTKIGPGRDCEKERKCIGGEGACPVEVVTEVNLGFAQALTSAQEAQISTALEETYVNQYGCDSVTVVLQQQASNRRLMTITYTAVVTMKYKKVGQAETSITNVKNSAVASSISQNIKAKTGLVATPTVTKNPEVVQDQICKWSKCMCPGSRREYQQLHPPKGSGKKCANPPVGKKEPCYCQILTPSSSSTISPLLFTFGVLFFIMHF